MTNCCVSATMLVLHLKTKGRLIKMAQGNDRSNCSTTLAIRLFYFVVCIKIGRCSLIININWWNVTWLWGQILNLTLRTQHKGFTEVVRHDDTDLMASSWTKISSMGCWGAESRESSSLTAPLWNKTTGSPPCTQWTLQTSDDTYTKEAGLRMTSVLLTISECCTYNDIFGCLLCILWINFQINEYNNVVC